MSAQEFLGAGYGQPKSPTPLVDNAGNGMLGDFGLAHDASWYQAFSQQANSSGQSGGAQAMKATNTDTTSAT
jgi:hypothetical protein